MSNSRGSVFVRMAVAASLAVAGAAGMAGAQTAPNKDVMKASYTVKPIGDLKATPRPAAKNEDLSCDVTAAPTSNTALTFGNLGTIKVKTNSAGWDIRMTTANGGKLIDITSATTIPDTARDTWGNVTGITQIPSGSGTFLKYDLSGVLTDVVLDVAIGVAKSGKAVGNSAANATLFPLPSAPGVFIPPVIVPPTDVTASSLAGGAAQPVSFAKIIGAAGVAASTWGLYSAGIKGATSTVPETWASIRTGGFPAPGDNLTADEEYFYVNAGMNPTAVYGRLKGNADGKTFTETFTFELVSNF